MEKEKNNAQNELSRVYTIKYTATGALKALKDMECLMNVAINGTPTGDIRNMITDMNILRMQVISEIEQHANIKDAYDQAV